MSAAEWIAKRRELLDDATEGPWEATFGPRELARVWTSHPDDREALATITGFVESDDGAPDAQFIADARTSLPRALDALEAVLKEEGPGAVGDHSAYSDGYHAALDACREAIETALRGES